MAAERERVFDTCTWTCAGAGGGTCAASGSGDINDTIALPVNGTATYTVNCTVSAAASGNIANTALITAVGSADPNAINNSATDADTVTPLPTANVTGSKTAAGSFVAGTPVTYSIVLNNAGTGAQGDNAGDEFVDTLPAGLSLVSASAGSGTATSAANVVRWNGSIAAGGSVTITIVATIDVGATGVITNQGTINYDADGNGSNEATRSTDDPGLPGNADGIGFTVLAAGGPATPVPTLQLTALLALIAMVLLVGGWAMPGSTRR